MQIGRFELLTLPQAINFVALFVNAKYLFCDDIHVMGPIAVWVGLMGGASYVNIMHRMRELKTLK